MNSTPRYCSQLCANEALEAGVRDAGDRWIDTESSAFLDAQEDDSIEVCDWCI